MLELAEIILRSSRYSFGNIINYNVGSLKSQPVFRSRPLPLFIRSASVIIIKLRAIGATNNKDIL